MDLTKNEIIDGGWFNNVFEALGYIKTFQRRKIMYSAQNIGNATSVITFK